MRFCRPGGGRAKQPSWPTFNVVDLSVIRDGLEALRHDVAILPEEYRPGAVERIDKTLKKVKKVRPRMRSQIYLPDD